MVDVHKNEGRDAAYELLCKVLREMELFDDMAEIEMKDAKYPAEPKKRRYLFKHGRHGARLMLVLGYTADRKDKSGGAFIVIGFRERKTDICLIELHTANGTKWKSSLLFGRERTDLAMDWKTWHTAKHQQTLQEGSAVLLPRVVGTFIDLYLAYNM